MTREYILLFFIYGMIGAVCAGTKAISDNDKKIDIFNEALAGFCLSVAIIEYAALNNRYMVAIGVAAICGNNVSLLMTKARDLIDNAKVK